MANTSYYLYQKYVKYGSQDWIPVYPPEYAISGDAGQNPVIKLQNDPNCGYFEPEYRWHQEDISEDYICSAGTKYYVEIYQVSYDGGFTWQDVSPEQTRKGSVYESGSSDCIEYRWVNMDISTDWICDECPELKLKATYSDSSEYEVYCNSSTTLRRAEVTGHSTPYSAMTSAVIGSCVSDIGDSAFLTVHNSSLTSCTIGNNVITIGYAAFQECSGLTSINIPNSVTSIGYSAFLSCSSLTSATIGSGVTSIGSNAFNRCRNLASVNIPSGVTIINTAVFDGCRSLTSITIPSGVTSIGNYAFRYCVNLTSVDIPDNVTSIGDAAFEKCSGMTSVTIGSGVTSIEQFAFDYCHHLTSIDIPNSVTSIGDYAFISCSGMTNVTIGSGVTSIGYAAFQDCSGLTSFTITAVSPPTLGKYALTITNNLKIYVPAASVNAYKSASGWSTYASRIQAIPT